MKRKRKWLAIVLAVSLLGFGTAETRPVHQTKEPRTK
jgi:hypothetical protein